MLCILGFGLGTGVMHVGVYVTARFVSRRIIRRHFPQVKNPTDIPEPLTPLR